MHAIEEGRCWETRYTLLISHNDTRLPHVLRKKSFLSRAAHVRFSRLPPCRVGDACTRFDQDDRSLKFQGFEGRGPTGGRRYQTLLVSATPIHHGQSVQRTREAPRRRSGRGDTDQRLLDGQIRGDPGRLETAHRKAAGRVDGAVASRG